jgi:aminoglycoside phosphotransferase (APT) family kinase protein
MSAEAPEPSERNSPVTLDSDRITTTTRHPDETRARLQAWMVTTLGPDSHPVVSELSSPGSNGMSSETVLFTARWDDHGVRSAHRLVARIEPPATAYPVFTTYDLDMQFRVMRLVAEHTAVPVPETLWYEPDPAALGGAFFVMARVDGQVPPDVLPYTFGDNWVFDATAGERGALQETAVGALAGIHSITPDRYDLGYLQPGPPGATTLERLFHRWKAYCAWVVKDTPSPLLASCFDWLEENLPTEVGADALSWGDSRIGNMMFRSHGVVAVLDWEMASVAPPEVDLGWMCYLHLFFHDLATDLGAPGLPDMFRPVDVAASYARASGYAPVDLTWFVAFAAVRHGAIMRRVTERAIFFGEASMPDDVDDLIIHRQSLRRMLDGSYWSGVAI